MQVFVELEGAKVNNMFVPIFKSTIANDHSNNHCDAIKTIFLPLSKAK